MKWYKRAAENEDPRAQHNLGILYLSGEGVEKNLEKAKKYFKKAAEQSLGEAVYHLSLLYETEGKVRKSKRYLHAASLLEVPEAQYNFAVKLDLNEVILTLKNNSTKSL